MSFLNINGPVEADTVYYDNKLVAKDVGFKLPEVAPIMADVEAMGTMSIPIWSRLENMEYSINKIGIDYGLSDILKAGMKPLEFRWIETIVDADGNIKSIGCKAFIKGISTSVPGFEITPGEASENEYAGMATRYQLFADGKEVHLFDRLAGIVRIGGVDYSSGTKNLL